MSRNGNKIFVSITNKQIYQELCDFKKENAKQHQEIMNEITKYKGQVSNLQMALGGMGVLLITTLGFLVNHLT